MKSGGLQKLVHNGDDRGCCVAYLLNPLTRQVRFRVLTWEFRGFRIKDFGLQG